MIQDCKKKTLPFVSFIIPTLNAEKTLYLCLKSVFEIDYPKNKYEILIIDNGSTDNTLKIAQKFKIKYFIKPNLTIAALRNYGAQHSKGEILAFVDADCIIQKDWLKNAINILTDEKIGVTGCYYGIPQNASWIVRAWYLPQNVSLQKVNFIPSGNLIVKREVFNKVRGFDKKLITGEDYDFCQRVKKAGYSIISSSSIQAIHLDDTNNLKKFLKKEIWYGKGMLPSIKKLSNKTVLLCHMFAASLIVFFLSIIFRWKYLWIVSSFLLFGIPIFSAFYRNFLKIGPRKIKYFFYLIPIYFTYFLGRTISLFWIYGNLFWKILSR